MSSKIFLVLFASLNAFAAPKLNLLGDPNQTFLPDEVEVPISKVYIPQGFDDNDRVDVMIEGTLPNTCYRLGPTVKYFKNGEFNVGQKAYFYKGVCLQVLVPFSKTVDFDIIKKAGTYPVLDAYSRKNFGTLPIAHAKSADPDDYVYAFVEDAYFSIHDSEKSVVLKGQLPGSCWKLHETKTIVESGDVVTILPILDYAQSEVECTRAMIPFMASVKLPETLSKGRYLVQIRSLNGQSINKLFDLPTSSITRPTDFMQTIMYGVL